MEAGFDNANNPFTNSNGTLKNLDLEADNIHLQKSGDGLLLNLTDNFKANGTNLSQDIFEKSNGTKKSSSDIHFDDDFGPETDVDAVDDAFSPVEKNKSFADCLKKGFDGENLSKVPNNDDVMAFNAGLANNNPLDDAFNPFSIKEVEENIKDSKKEEDFEEHGGDNREETPTPPVDTVHDVGGLEDNPAESDSEDEWNYFKGDQAKPETLPSQPETVVESSELEDDMSQLNPNAAEFVPVSPTRSIPSPVCRALINDQVISQSPKRPVQVDISVPNETEFESEVKSRPSDFDAYSNGHDSDSEHNISSGAEQIESILNGKSIDEIPEFRPGSTPAKQLPSEEFHFGPNAAPFTPKPLDQSEAFSTKANYGDDTEHTLNTSFNDSELAIPHKEMGDPMSMSFSAERGESNPFQDDEDLNKVHDLPENLDEFLEKNGVEDDKENRFLDDTISDLPEHDILGHVMDNDQAAIQTTDLDKLSQDDEKELASPLEPDQDDFLDEERNINAASKTPESNLLDDFVVVPEKVTTDDSNIASLPDLEPIPAFKSEDKNVSLMSEVHQELSDSRLSPLPVQQELEAHVVQSVSPTTDPLSELSEPKSPLHEDKELIQAASPLPEEAALESKSPLPEEVGLLQPKSPLPGLLESKSPVPTEQEHQMTQDILLMESQLLGDCSQVTENQDSGRLESQSPACEFTSGAKSPLEHFEESKSPICEPAPTSDMLETDYNPKSEVENIHTGAKSPETPEEPAASPSVACEYSLDPLACEQESAEVLHAESQSPFDLQHEQKHEEEITSSVKDDISSPIEALSPVKSPEPIAEESFTVESMKQVESAFSFVEEQQKLQEQEAPKAEVPAEVPSQDLLGDFSCPLPSSQPLVETEPMVEKIEFNAFEASAPFEPSIETAVSNGLDIASNFNEEISIKTDSIKPEFAEAAVISPSEDSKVIDDVPVVPTSEAQVPEQQPEIKSVEPTESSIEVPKEIPSEPSQIVPTESSQGAPKELPVLAPLPIVPLAPQEPKEVKKEEKKSSTTPSARKSTGKLAPSKTSTTPKTAAVKASPKPAAGSPKTGAAPRVPSKTGPAKPAITVTRTTTTTTAAPKPSAKPKTTAAPKPIDKKPLTNGDVKPAPRTTLTKKPSTEAPATKTTARPSTGAAKTSPTKTTAPRPATAPKAAPKTGVSAAAPKPAGSTTSTAKPRVPLSSRTTTTSTANSKLASSTTTTKTTTTTATRTALSPKTTTAPAKPKTLTSAPPKPRVPLTKTITKSADLEKEKKESANKLTASRTTTVSKTTSGTATSKTATTTMKKTESKPLSHRTAASKTSTTTTKTTVSKKPGEIKSVTKTKTTKIEKPKENGVAPASITEEIKEVTIVSNVVSDTESLIKDNSPLDNKLITETTNTLIDVNPAD